MKTQFVAPQKSLQSSWKHEAFTKPKKTVEMIKKSLGNKPQSLVYIKGSVTKAGNAQHSNLY